MTAPPKLDIDVAVQDPGWLSFLADAEELAEKAVTLALQRASLPDILQGRDIEVSIVLANDDLVHVLNREYRGKDKPTNVLSFAAIDAEGPDIPEGEAFHIGDVVMALETIERETLEQSKTFEDHFIHMMVHGTLHLVGYDHIEDEDANNMEKLEIAILAEMGIENPYTEIMDMA